MARISGGNFCRSLFRKYCSSADVLSQSISMLFKSRSVRTRSIRSAGNRISFVSALGRFKLDSFIRPDEVCVIAFGQEFELRDGLTEVSSKRRELHPCHNWLALRQPDIHV
jgi:hypothetical protein